MPDHGPARTREEEEEEVPLTWEGCTHLDCLPECRHDTTRDDYHCERFARLTQEPRHED